MLKIIIRANLQSPDISISARNISDFKVYIIEFFKLVRENHSIFYLEDPYLFNRLIECTSRIQPTPVENCPLIFDSWSCFNPTSPRNEMTESCPNFPNLKFSGERFASKTCDTNGSWWVHPWSNRTWSNYTNCVDYEGLKFRSVINNLSLVGLSTSLFCLLLSLIVFYAFASLSCGRVTMHKNLFLSLSLSSVSWLFWFNFVLFDIAVWSSNVVWCRILHVVTTYCTLTTYFWMLCEGTYLHLVLVNTLMLDRCRVKLLLMVGWVAPIFVIVPYAVYRQKYENSHCWMDMGNSNWILGVPVLLVMILNIVFLSHVILLLRSKVTACPVESKDESSTRATMKQARAAMFLVPILGLYFVLLPIRPGPGSQLEYFYDIFSSISSAFQGTFVSLLLCFTNGEVLHQIKQRWQQYKLASSPSLRLNGASV
jgi:calcitonin receptor-like